MEFEMLTSSPKDNPQQSFFDIFDQLNKRHPLIVLGDVIQWSDLESEFSDLYSKQGRAAKPIRLMCGLLMLKQLQLV